MRVSFYWKKLSHQFTAFLVLGVGPLLVCQSCATYVATGPLPQSPWGGKYAYRYDLPIDAKVSAPGAVPVTVAVINPAYKEDESALATEPYTLVGKGLSSSMGADLDKILIAKGVTTTGPFPSLDEITYTEKQDATLTLAPKIFITADIRYTDEKERPLGTLNENGDRWSRDFVMVVTGWVSFIMQEPLSGQKMWIKKLELNPVQKSGVVVMASNKEYDEIGIVIAYAPGEILYDGRADAMASALKEIYPVVLAQFQKYIDTNEMIVLKEKTKEIREAKVY